MKPFGPTLILILFFSYISTNAQPPGLRPSLVPWHERFDIKKVALSADGQYMITTGDDQAVMITDLKKRLPLEKIMGVQADFLETDPAGPFFYTMKLTGDSIYLQRRNLPAGEIVAITALPRVIAAASLSQPRFGFFPLVSIDFALKKFRICYEYGDTYSPTAQVIVEFSEDGKVIRQVRGIDRERVNAIRESNNVIWVATSTAIWKQKGDHFEKVITPVDTQDRFANMQFRNDTLVVLSGYVQWINSRNLESLARVSVKDFFTTGDHDLGSAAVMQVNHPFILDEDNAVWLGNTRSERDDGNKQPGKRIYRVARIDIKKEISYPLQTSEYAGYGTRYQEVSREMGYCPVTRSFVFLIGGQARADIVLKNKGHLFSIKRKHVKIEDFYLTAERGKLIMQTGGVFSDGAILDLSKGNIEPVSLRKDFHTRTDPGQEGKTYKPDTTVTRLYSPSRNGFIHAPHWRKGADLRISLPRLDSCKLTLQDGKQFSLDMQEGALKWTDKYNKPTRKIPLRDETGNAITDKWQFSTFRYDEASMLLSIYWEGRTTSLTKLVHIIQLNDRKLLHSWQLPDLLVLPGGKRFVTGNGIFNLADSTLLTAFPDGYMYAEQFITSEDGRFTSFVINKYDSDDELYTWDDETKRMALTGVHSGIRKILKDPHSNLFYTLGQDEKIKIWSWLSAGPVAEIVMDANLEPSEDLSKLNPGFLVIMPDGYYMGDRRYYEMLTWRDGQKEYPVFQMDAKFHRPDKVLKALGYADSSFIESLSRVAGKRLLRSAVSNEPEDIRIRDKHTIAYYTDTEQIRLPLSISGTPQAGMGLMIYINGTALWPNPGKTLAGMKPGQSTYYDISLVDAGNHIRVCLAGKDGKETAGDYLYINAEPVKKRDLYFVGIGVSQYKDPQFNLRYAGKDMDDIHKYLKTTTSFEKVNSFTSKDQRVTREVVDSIRNFLQSATAKDQVIVYYAGHGMLDTVSGNYFLSTHVWQPEKPAATGLNIDDLNNAIAACPARKKVMMVDACNSGLMDSEYTGYAGDDTTAAVVARGFKVKSRPQEEKLVRFAFNHFNQGNGVDILAASAGNEFAFETDSLKNGLFTYSLLSAFKSGDADVDKDSVLSISELQEYVGNMVKRLSKGRQQPSFRQANLYQDIAMLSSDDSYFAAMLWGAQNNHVPTLQVCIEQENIPVDKKDESGFTALHYACRQGGYNAVKYLVEKKADITLRTEFHFSCLYLAAINKHERVVHYLLSNGAVVKDQISGRLSLDSVYKKSTPFIRSMLQDFSAIKKRDEKQYGLIRLLATGNIASADSTWKAGSLDVDYWHYGEGINALFSVIFQKQAESLNWLLEKKVNVNYTNEDIAGFTPLMAAAYSNNLVAAKLLVDHGADIKALDKNGRTARKIAIQNRSKEVADFLGN